MAENDHPSVVAIKYGTHSKEELARGAHVQVISPRAVLLGLLIFALLGLGAFFWRLAAQRGSQAVLKEFEFSIEEPVADDFELKDPIRDILRETPEEMPKEKEEERPDIQMAVVPAEVQVPEEHIKSENIEVETPTIEPAATEIDLDAPEQISETSETVTYAVDPISASAPGPADIFKYKEPSPRDKPLLHWINRAPKPSRVPEVLPKAFGDKDAPTLGKLGPANINLFGTGDFFRAMTAYGGVKAKSAVDSALYWLATHQEPDGHWDSKKYEGAETSDSAVTGLAVMAFMGGGHTIRRGEYRRNVLRGLEWLIRQQAEDGSVNKNMYCQAICTIALCEAYGRTRDERIGLAARKAVAYCEKAVNPDGGWRYTANCGLSDMSVTGWVIMALKTAKLADIKFDHAVYSQSLAFVDSVTDQGASQQSNGVVTYMFKPGQNYETNAHPALTAAGMMVRQFSGVGVKSHILVKGAELTRQVPPDWGKKDFYLWYYATYAMHNMGGEYRVWWNRRMRDVLLENQCQEGDNAGSWDPKADRWAARAGRVYTTALGALCLEVYYRYSEALNSFGVAPDLDDLFFQ
ncbi:MAG: terpene cyclase/mutase family protein [Planctomycetes bacterium]|nr:terpene cyclase/mutase family protein [Planctomycetota bacterium]